MLTGPGTASPDWLSKGDNAWQMTAATLVCIQNMPGLVILYGSMVKKKWAVNSAFMAFYAFAAVLICWVGWAYRMSFGERLLPLWGKAGPALGQDFLLKRADVPSTARYTYNKTSHEKNLIFEEQPAYAMAALVYYHFGFAAITLIFLAGSLVGRMNFMAWMLFVPMWLTFSYTVGAFSLWGGGFLYHWGVLDFAGGYVIHLSSGTAGLTAAYWVGPRLKKDRERFLPNNVLLMLTGAGLLWLGWSGFNGGAPYAANIQSSMAVLNTHICTATSVLTWTCLDVIFFGKPSVIGAVQGMMTGLVCITPGAGLVQGWAALLMGVVAGTFPWFTMLIIHKKSTLLQKIDDSLGAFHTHAVAGAIGGILIGFFAEPKLCSMFMPGRQSRGAVYGGSGGAQLGKQIVGAMFVATWNVIVTSLICLTIRLVVPLRMPDEELFVGDDAAHGEEAYALWGDGERLEQPLQIVSHDNVFLDTSTTNPSIKL